MVLICIIARVDTPEQFFQVLRSYAKQLISADMVLGHEGVGIVQETGPDVKYMKKGDRVGWGYEHDSCGHCQKCLSGRETYCPERKFYGEADLDQGSMATEAVWREAFLFKIPENMSNEAAAPLQCGGATVFNALHAYDTQPTDTVGIMGVGGLGTWYNSANFGEQSTNPR